MIFFIFVSWCFVSVMCISEPWPPFSRMHTHKYKILSPSNLKNGFHQKPRGRANTCHITSFHGCFSKTLLLQVVSFPAEQREEMEIQVSTFIVAANERGRYLAFICGILNVFVLFTWELPLMPFYSFSRQYSDFVCVGLW